MSFGSNFLKSAEVTAFAVINGFIGSHLTNIYGSTAERLCESQASRVQASAPSNIFNRCTRNLPDGTILTWNREAQHQKDLDAGVALKME